MEPRPRVLSAQPIPVDSIPQLESVKLRLERLFRMEYCLQPNEEEVFRAIGDQEALIVPWTPTALVTPRVLERAGKLKVIGATYGGLKANVAATDALRRGIALTCTGPARARSVAEFTLGLILDAGLHVSRIHHAMRVHRDFPRFGYTRELTGREVGIIGLGHISRELIGLLAPFGVRIRVCSAHATPAEAGRLGVELASLEELLRASQIIVVQTGLTERTRRLLGPAELDLICPGALLVNTARGGLIDEPALIERLRTGRFDAALDVYEIEPLPPDSPLRDLDNVVLTAHSANSTLEMDINRWQFVTDELERFFRGDPMVNRITAETLSRMSDS